MTQRTSQGDRLQLTIEILDEDGELVERTDPDEPFVIQLGDGELPPTVEEALADVPVGTTIEVTCPEGEAFGDPDPEAIVAVAREEFPDDLELEKGGLVNVQVIDDDGTESEMPAVIVEVNPDGVILDANHPLAGCAATFRVTVDAIVE